MWVEKSNILSSTYSAMSIIHTKYIYTIWTNYFLAFKKNKLMLSFDELFSTLSLTDCCFFSSWDTKTYMFLLVSILWWHTLKSLRHKICFLSLFSSSSSSLFLTHSPIRNRTGYIKRCSQQETVHSQPSNPNAEVVPTLFKPWSVCLFNWTICENDMYGYCTNDSRIKDDGLILYSIRNWLSIRNNMHIVWLQF